jgi:prepilin-type N-terminal cleavage/methylation domain-containing protein
MMRAARARRVRDRRAGFGLVELIIALMILSVGLLALSGAAAIAQRSFNGAQALEEGAHTAGMILDSLMGVADPATGERQDGRTRTQWRVHEDSIAVVIDLTVTVGDGARERHLTFIASHHGR